MSSCLGDSKSYDSELPKNCQISSFTLQHDSISELSTTKFTIDQVNGRIFNLDSLPYGTEIDKVVCKIEYINAYAVTSLRVMQEAVGDTIDWNASDSLDFSKPVKFVVGAYDGITTKNYLAQVNVHHVVPDSLPWHLYTEGITDQTIREQKAILFNYGGKPSYLFYVQPAGADAPYSLYYSDASDLRQWTSLSLEGLPAGKIRLAQLTGYENILYLPSTDGVLYQSTDGLKWSPVEGTPHVSYLMGYVKESDKQISVLTAITEENGTLYFASMNKNGEWAKGDQVPDAFPLTGFGNENYNLMYFEYLLVVAGKDKNNKLLNNCWGTKDGLSWANYTPSEATPFSKREGVMVTAYDDKIWMIGGLNGDGNGLKDIYQTIDKGVTWSLLDTLVTLPDNYKGRGFSSLVVDDEKFITIFGGKTSASGNNEQEIWRGRINRLGFKK